MAPHQGGINRGKVGAVSWRCRILACTAFVGLILILLSASQGLDDDASFLDVSSPQTMQQAAKEQVASEQEISDRGSMDRSQSLAQEPTPDASVKDSEAIVAAPQPPPGDQRPKWMMMVSCVGGKGVSCKAACADRGLRCDAKALRPLFSIDKLSEAVQAAGSVCNRKTKVDKSGQWDGPHVRDGECTYNTNVKWSPSCDRAPACGLVRVCPCMAVDPPMKPPNKFKQIKDKPLNWFDIPLHIATPIHGDWVSETQFLDKLLRVFGKLRPRYKGPQRLMGFKQGQLFDDAGMFAFDDSVRSVAFDVGAANNPLVFDLPIDNSQVAFYVEPVQWRTLEEDIQREATAFHRQGGCKKYWNAGICSRERALVFPAAVSEKLGHATFHVTGNPYCGSLEAFTGDTSAGSIENSLKNHKNKEVRGIYEACYKDAGQNRDVATISLKAVLDRIPKHIAVKYMKIDAQGHDYKVFLSAGDQISRIEYVRFEMQVDPAPGRHLVKDIPSYAEVKARMAELGFKHEGKHACHFDPGAHPFSIEVREMECVFCRKLPCIENGRLPRGPDPGKNPIKKQNFAFEYIVPEPWQPKADTRAPGRETEPPMQTPVDESTPPADPQNSESSTAPDSTQVAGEDNAVASDSETEVAQDSESNTQGDLKPKPVPQIPEGSTVEDSTDIPVEIPEQTSPQDAESKTNAGSSDSSASTSDERPKEIFEEQKRVMPVVPDWRSLAKVVAAPQVGDWFSETQFLASLLRTFGKQRLNYKGFQKMDGLKPGLLFDENGMWAFDEKVRSVAIDVGAATNPLPFDLDIDSTQVAFFVEPVQWKTLETSVETDSRQLKARGGCTFRWDPFCIMDRFYIFPAAVSNELGHASFHATQNPYCGSLEAFTGEEGKVESKIAKSTNMDIRGIFEQCYKNAGPPTKVATVSLKAIIERVPKHIPIKYVKIDAQGHDYKVLLSAGDQISRIEYVRFEMQVDPPEGRKLVADIPSYDEIVAKLQTVGLKKGKAHACFFDGGASPFTKAVKEMECVFCRKPPCVENARPPLGENPRKIADRRWNARKKAKLDNVKQK